MDEPFETANVDEQTEVDDAADDALDFLIRLERVEERLALRALAIFDVLLVRDDQVLVTA
ncbi:MAG: hypothetical protein WCQ45_02200 [bacterium]